MSARPARCTACHKLFRFLYDDIGDGYTAGPTVCDACVARGCGLSPEAEGEWRAGRLMQAAKRRAAKRGRA